MQTEVSLRRLTMPQRHGEPINPCVHKAARLPLPAWMLIGIPAAFFTACAGPPVVSASSASCAALLPATWKEGVAGAPLPDGNSVGDWIAFGDAQTGKLDQANGRTTDAIGIVERCEARDAAAVKKATHRFLGIF